MWCFANPFNLPIIGNRAKTSEWLSIELTCLHNARAPTAGAQTLLCPCELSHTIITSHPTVYSPCCIACKATGHLPQLHNLYCSVGLFRRNPAYFLWNLKLNFNLIKQPHKLHGKKQQPCLFLLLDINLHAYRIKKAVGADMVQTT